MDPILIVSELSAVFRNGNGGLPALESISFQVCPQEFLCVLGPSGSGKSTLLRILAGLLPGTTGEVVFNGVAVHGPRRGVGFVFQRANLMPWRTVLGNITLPLELQRTPAEVARKRAQELVELVGALDSLTRERMGDELLRIWQARQKTVVMVTHSISEALFLADRVLVLSPRPGRVILDLPVDLPRPRQESIRYTAQFGELARRLRAAIG